ncbi:hypothetical protein BKA69DRAFT_1077983 [Paraphysoderma sedebokerense]|nr:hypothetical protein BKA69DRAFT_1077983 [Paraphysoderma sedebokerense]
MNDLYVDDKFKFDLLDENVGMDDTMDGDAAFAGGFKSCGNGVARETNEKDTGALKGLTLKEQEKIIDEVKKENFGLKMRIYFLEERLAKMAPDNLNEALKENIELKIQNENYRNKLDNLESELSNSQSTIKSLQSTEIHSLQRSYETKLASQQTAVNNLTEQLESTRRNHRDLQDTVTDLTHEKASLKATVDLQLSEIDALKTELGFVKTDKERLKEQVLELQIQLEGQNQEIKRGKKELARSLRMNEALKQKVSNGENFKRDRDGDSDDEVLDARNKKSKSSDSGKNVSDLERKLKDYKERVSHLKSEMTAQNLVVAAKDEEITSLQVKIDKLKKQVGSSRSGVKSIPNANPDEMSGGLDQTSLQPQVSSLQRKLAAKSAEIQSLTKQLEAKTHSHEKSLQNLMDAWTKDQAQLKQVIVDLRKKLTRARQDLNSKNSEMESGRMKEMKYEQGLKELLEEANGQLEVAEKRGEQFRERVMNLQGLLTERENEVLQLSKELSVKQEIEAGLQEELATLQSQLTSIHSTTHNTSSRMSQLQSELNTQLLKINDLETRWKSEIERRCQIEEREIKRVTELDSKYREELKKRERLERKMKEKEENMVRVFEETEGRVKEALESQAVGFDVEFEREKEKWRLESKSMEKTTSQLRHQLTKTLSQLKERDSEIKRLQSHLDNINGSKFEQHDKLKDIVEKSRLEVDKYRQELDWFKDENENQGVKVRGLEDLVEKMEHENKVLTEKVHKLSKLQDKIGDRENMLYDATRREEELEREIEHSRNVIEELRGRLGENHTQTETKSISLQTELAKRDSIISQIHKILNSITGLPGNASPRAVTSDPKTLGREILEKLNSLETIRRDFEGKVRKVEESWGTEFKLLIRKLEKRLQQLEKFEGIVRNVSGNVKKWRELVADKSDEIAVLQAEVKALQTQLSVFQTTRPPLGSISVSSKSYHQNDQENAEVDLHDRIMNLEKQVLESEEKLRMERRGARDRVNELTENIRNLERQLETSKRKNLQMQELLTLHKANLQTALSTAQESTLSRSKTESTLARLNEQLREELSHQTRMIGTDSEKLQTLEKRYNDLLTDYKKLQKQLGKREALIAKALGRLELINSRKNAIEVAMEVALGFREVQSQSSLSQSQNFPHPSTNHDTNFTSYISNQLDNQYHYHASKSPLKLATNHRHPSSIATKSSLDVNDIGFNGKDRDTYNYRDGLVG